MATDETERDDRNLMRRRRYARRPVLATPSSPNVHRVLGHAYEYQRETDIFVCSRCKSSVVDLANVHERCR